MMTVILRAAHPYEANALVELLLRSKAVWGYDAAFMAETRRQAQKSVTPAYVATHPVFVAEVDGIVAGFYSLCPWTSAPNAAEIDWLFVEPAHLRRKIGQALGEHAITTARQLGFHELYVVSDPNAEDFYATLGMTRCGEEESSVVPGRMLPMLRLPLHP